MPHGDSIIYPFVSADYHGHTIEMTIFQGTASPQYSAATHTRYENRKFPFARTSFKVSLAGWCRDDFLW
jgi:hypothetical protein